MNRVDYMMYGFLVIAGMIAGAILPWYWMIALSPFMAVAAVVVRNLILTGRP